MANLLGHESLVGAKILHRDISIGNIMLEMAEDDGFLIDLDLAIKLDRKILLEHQEKPVRKCSWQSEPSMAMNTISCTIWSRSSGCYSGFAFLDWAWALAYGRVEKRNAMDE